MNMSVKLNIKTTYAVKTLVSWLRENKMLHLEAYQEALTAYTKKKAVLLDKLSVAVQAGKEDDITNAYYKWNTLVKPVDASKMYDEYIQLLNASDAESIELSAQDASAIINDSWDWAQSAKLTNSTYLAR